MAFSIDDAWDNSGPVARAGNTAFGLYCRCGAWAARNSTDGFVPAEIALAYGSPELATKLVAVGLWEAVDGGWSAPDYLLRNESAEQVASRRKREADRKAAWRERQKSQAKTVPRDTTRTGRGRPRGQDAEVRAPFTTPKGVKGDARAPSPHTFAEGDDGWCSTCKLPRVNKIHLRGAA